MLSSSNVIKKTKVSSKNVYTIEAPIIPIESEVSLDNGEEMDIEAKLRDIESMKAHAENLIKEANNKARLIIEQAASEAEKIKKDAYDTAFKKGYSEGHKSGTEEGFKSTAAVRKNAEDVLKDAHRSSREYIDRQKGEIVDLALYIAEKIIGYQAESTDAVVVNIVKNAIESAVLKGQVVIRVNPVDYALLDCRRDELLEIIGENTIISIIKDSEIKRGGCRLDTGAGSVDAAIDSQLQKIKEALQG